MTQGISQPAKRPIEQAIQTSVKFTDCDA